MAMEDVASSLRRYKPYFAPPEVAYLVQLNAGKLTPARVEANRQLACGLIDRIGARLGFPRRTIATAQVLYHRFHLFFPLRDFAVQDIAISTLLVSSKLEDTLKKLREIQVAAFQVKAAEEGLASLAEPDQQVLEADRARLIGVERLILETISFNFNLRSTAAYATRASKSNSSQNRDVFAYVIKLGSFLGASKDYVKRAFRMAIDAHRTLLPLSYPPHAIAAACLYLTSFLTSEELEGGSPSFQAGWAESIRCELEDVEDICHGILDLMLAVGPSAIKTSPSEFSLFQSPRETAVSNMHTGTVLASELTHIKIRLRDNASKRKADVEGEDTAMQDDASQSGKRMRMDSGGRLPSEVGATPGTPTAKIAPEERLEEDRRMLGRDDVTVRFLWE